MFSPFFFFSSKTRIFRILVSLLDAKKLIKKRDRVLSRRDELLKLTKVRLRMLQFVFLFLFFPPLFLIRMSFSFQTRGNPSPLFLIFELLALNIELTSLKGNASPLK